jgi:hypothetical protein
MALENGKVREFTLKDEERYLDIVDAVEGLKDTKSELKSFRKLASADARSFVDDAIENVKEVIFDLESQYKFLRSSTTLGEAYPRKR